MDHHKSKGQWIVYLTPKQHPWISQWKSSWYSQLNGLSVNLDIFHLSWRCWGARSPANIHARRHHVVHSGNRSFKLEMSPPPRWLPSSGVTVSWKQCSLFGSGKCTWHVQGKLASHFVTSLTSSLSQTKALSGVRPTSGTLGDCQPTSSGNQR